MNVESFIAKAVSGDTLGALSDLREAVKDIEARAKNFYPGIAHAKEDEMFTAVLEAIRQGAPNSGELAAMALHSKTIVFDRYCG